MVDLSAIDPQAAVILAIGIIGLIPVALYYERTFKWFIVAYGFLMVAAFSTNVENLVLPNALNFTEHFVGNMGAGIAFAVAAYLYRKRQIDDGMATPDGDPETEV